jgi:endo-1,4-beta-xylanase
MRGTPVHAVGIQAHLDGAKGAQSMTTLSSFLADIASMGFKILITELDVKDPTLPSDINERDRMVAAVYEDFLTIALDQPSVISVITWGLSDKYTWLSDYAPRKDGMPVRPLPLDENMNRKSAWNAIARAFDATSPR